MFEIEARRLKIGRPQNLIGICLRLNGHGGTQLWVSLFFVSADSNRAIAKKLACLLTGATTW